MKISEIHDLTSAKKYCKEWNAKHKNCKSCGIGKYCMNRHIYPLIPFDAIDKSFLQKIIAYGRKQKLKKLLS